MSSSFIFCEDNDYLLWLLSVILFPRYRKNKNPQKSEMSVPFFGSVIPHSDVGRSHFASFPPEVNRIQLILCPINQCTMGFKRPDRRCVYSTNLYQQHNKLSINQLQKRKTLSFFIAACIRIFVSPRE